MNVSIDDRGKNPLLQTFKVGMGIYVNPPFLNLDSLRLPGRVDLEELDCLNLN